MGNEHYNEESKLKPRLEGPRDLHSNEPTYTPREQMMLKFGQDIIYSNKRR